MDNEMSVFQPIAFLVNIMQFSCALFLLFVITSLYQGTRRSHFSTFFRFRITKKKVNKMNPAKIWKKLSLSVRLGLIIAMFF